MGFNCFKSQDRLYIGCSSHGNASALQHHNFQELAQAADLQLNPFLTCAGINEPLYRTMDTDPNPFAWQSSTRTSEFKSFVGDGPSDPLLTHQSTRASAINSILGDGQSSHDHTFSLIFERQFKTHWNNEQIKLEQTKKPFLVANKETFLGLCADIMCIFDLDYLPILKVKWFSLNGREEETIIDDQNITPLLRLLRSRGSVDKIRVYKWA